MQDPADGRATHAFLDAVSIWRLTDGAVDEVIDGATECLVEGVDSPTLRVLAGESPRESRFVLGPMIEDTLRELGLDDLLAANRQRAALSAMLRRFKAGSVSGRDLAKWAHTHIGHEGVPDCQAFVDLDDMWDGADYAGFSVAELEDWTAQEADAFLAGRPSPGSADVWRSPTADSSPQPRSRRRGGVRRLLRNTWH